MKYTVYMHVSPSNKRYIGITSQTTQKRWKNGYGYKDNIRFWNSIQKYKWENFQHVIIAKGLTEEEAKWLEIELIKKWNSSDRRKGYNVSPGGDTISMETRKKISEGNLGKVMTQESREKMSKAKMGKKLSDETKKRMSSSHLGEKHHLYGKHHTEETKQKLSKSHKSKMMGGKHPQAKRVLCVETGQIFESKKEAYLSVNGCKRGLDIALKENRKYKGCTFQSID